MVNKELIPKLCKQQKFPLARPFPTRSGKIWYNDFQLSRILFVLYFELPWTIRHLKG